MTSHELHLKVLTQILEEMESRNRVEIANALAEKLLSDVQHTHPTETRALIQALAVAQVADAGHQDP